MVWIIVLVVLFLLVLYGVGVYNKLVRLRNQSEESGAAIDAHLKKRYDLIPNLVETVKGYATHEQETLTNVIKARNSAMGGSTLSERNDAANAFSQTLKSLFALSESYPDLKANQGFLDLQKQLQLIEDEDFGYCVTCGIEIGIRRLEARPTADQCIDCKTLSEIKEKQSGR